MNLKSRRGVTLTEAMVAIAILGATASTMILGSRIIQWMQRQFMLAQIQQEAQLQLYAITRDVRNAYKIHDITHDKLVLRAMNFRLGYDTQGAIPSPIFNENRIGTITYQFVQSSSGTQLRRIEVFDGITRETHLLRNILNTPTPTDYLFTPFPIATLPPYDAVQVVFRCGRGFFVSAPRIYQAEAMVRARN